MLFDKDSDKLNYKQYVDKSAVSSWAVFLESIWGSKLDIIEQKLVYNINDRYIWNSETEKYVHNIMNKLSKYNN